MLFGTSLSSSTKSVAKMEVLDVQAGGAGASLSATPKAGSLSIFLTTDGVAFTTEQTAGTPASTPNTYSLAGTTLTFSATTFASAGKVIAFYLLDSTVNNFTVNNVSFPGGYKIYADAYLRGTDQGDKYVQYQLLNVKPKSNVSLSMDADL